MKKFYKVSGKMQYILIYITHKYFFWNFILHETFFYTSYNRRESIKYGDCITQEKDITFYPDDRRKYLETYFIFFYSANSGKYASAVIEKLLKSAIANAENNNGMSVDNLYIEECYANKGPTMKRIRPRAQGRAYRIEKRMSHITIVLNER